MERQKDEQGDTPKKLYDYMINNRNMIMP